MTLYRHTACTWCTGTGTPHARRGVQAQAHRTACMWCTGTGTPHACHGVQAQAQAHSMHVVVYWHNGVEAVRTSQLLRMLLTLYSTVTSKVSNPKALANKARGLWDTDAFNKHQTLLVSWDLWKAINSLHVN